MKWLMTSQIDELNTSGSVYNITAGHLNYNSGNAPWIDWGTYMWAANSAVPCNGCAIPGLTWLQYSYQAPPVQCPAGQECDFQADDNTHPSTCGRDKVSNMLMYFYCNSPYTAWFRAPGVSSCMTTRPTNSCSYH